MHTCTAWFNPLMSAITQKTVVVVGGSRGIGAEFVRQFAQKGNRVIAACR